MLGVGIKFNCMRLRYALNVEILGKRDILMDAPLLIIFPGFWSG
jgi:hypothetical protein